MQKSHRRRSYLKGYLASVCWILASSMNASYAEITKPADAPPALSPEESLRTIKVPEGFRVELIASEPLLNEPSGVCWDARGRMFVCELHGYNLEGQYDIEELNKTGKLDRVVRRIQADEAFKEKAQAGTYGTVKLLTDTDCDGRMDHVEVWADRLPPCYGVCPALDGVIVACAPDIVFLADRDGDGHAEVREVLFTGFETTALERGISAPKWGHDGWIYMGGNRGGTITGPHLAQPVTIPNTDFRIKADGSQIEPIGGHTGTIGFAFTEAGDRFVMNTGSALFVAPLPWNYLARNVDAASPKMETSVFDDPRVFPRSQPHPWRTKRAQDPGFAKYYTDHHGERESAPNGFFTSACSPLVYRDRAMPELSGELFVCEPAQNLVHREALERADTRLTAHRVAGEEESEFLASSDTWFHPISLSHGPDGAIWITDYYREIIEDYSAIPRYLQQQYGLINGHDRGRIYRLVHKEMPTPPAAPMEHLSAAQLAQELTSPYLWRRETAQRLLTERQDKSAVTDLKKLVRESKHPEAVLPALYTLDALNELNAATLESALAHSEPSIRVHALRLADRRFADASLLDAALAMIDDPDPTVQLQLAMSLGESQDKRVVPALAKLARERGQVDWMPDAILSSLSGRAGAMLVELLREPDLKQADRMLEPLCTALAARRDAQEMSAALVQIAVTQNAKAQRACLQGLRSGFQQPTAMTLTEPARAALKTLVASRETNVHAAAESLAGVLRIESPAERRARLEKASEDVANVQRPLARRLAAIDELATERDSEMVPPLLQAFPAGTPPIREAILTAMFARRDRLSQVVAALEKGTIPPSALSALQRTALLDDRQPELKARAEKLFASTSAAIDEQLPSYVAALEAKRDPARGEKVFRDKCATCHQAHGVGFSVGPDLTAEFQRAEETIVRDILAPSDSITAGYTTYLVETSVGRVATGLVAGESANSILLREAGGKQQTILRKDIESLTASTVSLMPEDLYRTVSPQDLADALAWLRQPPTQIVLLDDDPALANKLTEGEGTVEFVTTDKQSGVAALRVTPLQRHSSRIPGWSFAIRERPQEGQFRYLQFAWKSDGAEGVMIELANNGHWPSADSPDFRYSAGSNTTPWQTTELSPDPPAEWTVVTRDLWKDFGDCTLTGIAPTAIGGPALFDSVRLMRSVEE